MQPVDFGCYGYSSDAGATWSANQCPIYSATAPLFNARYPQGMIYNAVGNTTPANAFVSYFAPSLAGLNAGWGGLVHGSSALTGGGTPTSTEDTSTSYLIPDGGALNTDDNLSGLLPVTLMLQVVTMVIFC